MPVKLSGDEEWSVLPRRSSGHGVFTQITEHVISEIQSGRLKPGDKLPSERELVEFFGLSRVTVRRALAELAAQGVLETLPGKGTFVKARAPVMRRRTGNIAVIRCLGSRLPTSIGVDVFYPAVFAGIEAEAAARDFHCIVQHYREGERDALRLEQLAQKVDGIICGELRDDQLLGELVAKGLPVVLISPSLENLAVDTVEVDNFGGAMQGMRHLLELGHRRIAFIGGPPGSIPSRQRQAGYREALTASGITPSDALESSRGWRLEDGYEAMKELLRRYPRPTAVFAASDLLALGACQAAREAGVTVGEELSVLGFDDIQLAQESLPALSTVRVLRKEIGETAARLLFEQIDGKRGYPLRVVVPTQLIVRASTGAVSVSKAQKRPASEL